MKQSPQMENLEKVLRSSKLVAGGFMGSDSRCLSEIIESDIAQIETLGFNVKQIADRMQEITQIAKPQLGNWIKINEMIEGVSQDYKGIIVCPWPHSGKFDKRITTVKRAKTGATIFWSDLNMHLIAKHDFFEGRGSNFRIEPKELIEIIF